MDKTPKTLASWLTQMYGDEVKFKQNLLQPFLFDKLLNCTFSFDEYVKTFQYLKIKVLKKPEGIAHD